MQLKVWYWLFAAKLKIAFRPYSALKKDLGVPMLTLSGESVDRVLHFHDSDAILKVQRWISKAQRWLPFRCQCLVLAIVARKALAQLGVPCELYLGVAKGRLRLKAHAWVKVGEVPVVGVFENGPHYTVVQIFGSGDAT